MPDAKPLADPPARLPQIRDDEFTDATRAFFDQWSGGVVKGAAPPANPPITNPVLRTFAHHPVLANAFTPLNLHILGANTLPVKQRQIAIMRVGWITGATYMWSSHLETSVNCGLSPDMYGPIQRGADDPYFTPFEATVIRATEELINDQKIGDANWRALMTEWDEKQMLDFLFTVGCYVMIAGVMRSTGAQRTPELLALAEQYGAPETA
jgi:alkylhydroperoxidase family enzyme